MRATPIPLSAKIVFAALVVVWLAVEVYKGSQRRTEASTQDEGNRLANLTPVIGVVASVFAAWAFPNASFANRDDVSWFGIGVFAVGFGLRLWCFRALGRYFTFAIQTSADQPVIQTGPYKYLRHPSFAGVLLVVSGIALFFGNYLALGIVFVSVFAGLAYRIKVEEAALERVLGERYREFAQGRKRMIPVIW